MDSGKSTSDRSDMALAFVVSALANLIYLFIAPADQRVLLLIFFTVILGLIGLVGQRTGAYAMGLILGSVAAVVIGLICVALGASPLAS